MLALLTPVLAAAGRGSGGYGGGGGGGGGGGFGGGGAGAGGSGGPWWLWALVFAGFLLFAMFAMVQAARYRRRRAERVRRTHLAAAEAAQDDADFDPAEVETAVCTLFREVQRRWTAGDRDGLAELVGEDLMVEWHRRLDDFARKGWTNVVEAREDPVVEYVGLVNREDDAEDRVVVRITATTEDYVRDRNGAIVRKDAEDDTTVTLREWWTLCPPGATPGWRLLSIESEVEGRHHLDSELIASPWADARVADAALVETAVAAAAPPGFTTAEIADPDLSADARAASLDLMLADGRFSPDVLAAAARRAVEAWTEAVDGDDAPLEALASPGAVGALLHGADGRDGRTRVVVRGGQVEHVRVATLDAQAQPPAMGVDVTVRARRYVEDRDTTDVLAGSKDAARSFTQRWTFALDGPPEAPWRLVAVA